MLNPAASRINILARLLHLRRCMRPVLAPTRIVDGHH
jgi:hypothetical protein